MKETAKTKLIFWMFTVFSGIFFVMFLTMATLVGFGLAAEANFASGAALGFFVAAIISGACAFWAGCAMEPIE